MEIPSGRGVAKVKILKEEWRENWKFQKVGRGLTKNNPLGRNVYFAGTTQFGPTVKVQFIILKED